MILALHDYDIYPKVIRTNKETLIRVDPMGKHAAFVPGKEYYVEILPTKEGCPKDYPDRLNHMAVTVKADERGALSFTCSFPSEQEYYIRMPHEDGRVQLAVYAVEEDLAGRYPFMGDLHMHTFRSDGREEPAIVAANYRKLGYDFLSITDHYRYYPSLEAIRAYQDVDSDYLLVPGEEVHLPGTDVHIVNFGGKYSVNAMLEDGVQAKEVGCGEEFRSLPGVTPPSAMTKAAFLDMAERLGAEMNLPKDVESLSYGVCCWAFDEIRKAEGLGIFCHPYWISDVYQVPESFVDYMMEHKPFDAFEVLGGERNFEQNGFQTVRYYEDRAKGRNYPIVGSTDSHRSVESNMRDVARTIVFSPENSREALISSIRENYTAAVDGISKEVRLVGESRFVWYGQFLLTHYFPLHDDLCHEEGRLMKEYCSGRVEVKPYLDQRGEFMRALRKKYFSF